MKKRAQDVTRLHAAMAKAKAAVFGDESAPAFVVPGDKRGVPEMTREELVEGAFNLGYKRRAEDAREEIKPRQQEAARLTNETRTAVTVGAARLFDEFRKQHPEILTDKDARPAFRSKYPDADLPESDKSLERLIRRGRRQIYFRPPPVR